MENEDSKRKNGNGSFSSEQRERKPSTISASYTNLTDAEKVRQLEQRLQERDEEIDFLKKYMPSLQNCKIKSKHWYAAIHIACIYGEYVPYRLCKAAGIDPSGYYHYVKRLNTPSTKKWGMSTLIWTLLIGSMQFMLQYLPNDIRLVTYNPVLSEV